MAEFPWIFTRFTKLNCNVGIFSKLQDVRSISEARQTPWIIIYVSIVMKPLQGHKTHQKGDANASSNLFSAFQTGQIIYDFLR